MRSILPADCARARQQLSLRADSELSEFESVLLSTHISRCDDCRAFEQGVMGLTDALRAVPMESPAISFEPPRRRGRLDVFVAASVRAGSAAAAIAVVAISGLIALNGPTQGVSPTELESARAVLNLHERQLQALDRFGETAPEVPRGLAEAERLMLSVANDSRRLEGRR
jgi:predicted anti-sigma-YlaC factor YlaD